jgi:hypothetical protein
MMIIFSRLKDVSSCSEEERLKMSKIEESNELLLISMRNSGKLGKEVSARDKLCFQGISDKISSLLLGVNEVLKKKETRMTSNVFI